MKDTKLYRSIMRLKEDLAAMTWGQRIGHLWRNYKQTILIMIVVCITLFSLAANMLANRQKLLLGGLAANVRLSEDGTAYIETGYFEKLDGDEALEKIEIINASFGPIADQGNFEANYYALTQTIAMLTESEIDFLLMDKISLEAYLPHGILLDIRKVFSEEELAQMGDKVIRLTTVDDESGAIMDEAYPVAIGISDMPFIQDCVGTDTAVYFGIAANAPNLDTVRDFWDYLISWQS